MKKVIKATTPEGCVPLTKEMFARGVTAVTTAQINQLKVSVEFSDACPKTGILADPDHQRLMLAAKAAYLLFPNRQLSFISRYKAMIQLRSLPQFEPWYTSEAIDSPTFVIRTEVFEVAGRMPLRRDGTFDPVAFLADLMDVTDLTTLPCGVNAKSAFAQPPCSAQDGRVDEAAAIPT